MVAACGRLLAVVVSLWLNSKADFCVGDRRGVDGESILTDWIWRLSLMTDLLDREAMGSSGLFWITEGTDEDSVYKASNCLARRCTREPTEQKLLTGDLNHVDFFYGIGFDDLSPEPADMQEEHN